jgi:hypothetical protein
MLDIFKTKIPKDDQQEVTELKSFTVKWQIKTGWGDAKIHITKYLLMKMKR